MISLQGALEIGRQTLSTRQQQLAVTGQNLANADRAGFHRRQVELRAAPPVRALQGEIGTGVQVQRVVRAYDESLEASFRQAGQQVHYYQTMGDVLLAAESRLAPQGRAATAATMNAFTTDWQRLAASPESRELRLAALSSARSLASQVQQDYRGLTTLRAQIADPAGRGDLAAAVGEANDIAAHIAQLNARIVAAERGGRPSANDLRDQRGVLVNRLAELVNVDVTESSDGSLELRLGTELMVQGDASRALALDMTSGAPRIVWADNAATASADGGEIGALAAGWQAISDRRDRLDAFAVALRDAVNGALAAGYDLDGQPGAPLFAGTGAGDVAVAIGDTRRLGLSDTAGETGNGNQAMALLTAFDEPSAALDGDTLRGYPDSWVAALAGQVADSERSLGIATASQTMYGEAVAARSGVSLDEEMIGMLELQRSYQAAAKFVAAVDEMLGQALSIIR